MISIAYCGDQKMLDGLTISLLSIIKHVNEPLDVHVLTATIDTRYKALNKTLLAPISDILKQRNHGQLTLYDITDIFNSEYPTANSNTIFTPNCMLRLFLDEIPNIPNRMLYLDTDIICHRNFTDFFHQDLNGFEFAGALDYYGKWFFHHHLTWSGLDYINSGMLLMNMCEIKKVHLLKQCRKLCTVHKMFLPDQGALNRLSIHKKIVSHKFNDQRRLHKNTVFQHFTTSFRLYPTVHTLTVKPWEIKKVHHVLHLHEYDDILNEYLSIKNESYCYD